MALGVTLTDLGGKQHTAPVMTLVLALALDTSYPTGGYAFDPQALAQTHAGVDKAPNILNVQINPKNGYIFEYVPSTKKIKVLVDSSSATNKSVMQNMALSAAGLTIGSSSKKTVKIANTVTYLAAGVFKSKTTAEKAFTATTHDITANALSVQEAVYVVSLQADGTVTLTKGTTTTGAGNAPIPDGPANETVIGYLRLAVEAGAVDFDASTDELDESHLTDTYTDVSFLPQMITEGPGAVLAEVANATNLSTNTAIKAIIQFN